MLYRVFSSLKTSIWLLSIVSLIYLLGTVFPQGVSLEDYSAKGGKFLFLVKTLSLLNVFASPLFLLLIGLLSLNLFVCIYDRYSLFRRRPKLLLKSALFSNPALIDMGKKDIEEVRSSLKTMGFRVIEEKDGMYGFEKGIPYWRLSWIYHLGVLGAIGGFLLTALMAFEKDVTLYKGRPLLISLYSKDTRLNEYLREAGLHVEERKKQKEYELTLKDFKTEYYQRLKVTYPKDKLSRLAYGLGFRDSDEIPERGFSPKMWKTELSIKTHEGKDIPAELWVNRPFRHKGITLYQMGFEQKIRFEINGRDKEINTMEPFEIKGIEGRFETSSVKTGILHKRDGSSEAIKPFFELSFTSDKGKKEPLGEIHLGIPKTIKGKRFVFKELKEASILSYRVDPGVPFIWGAILLVFVGLTLRCLGYYYRVQIGIRDERIFMLISTRGLLANKDRVTERMKAKNN